MFMIQSLVYAACMFVVLQASHPSVFLDAAQYQELTTATDTLVCSYIACSGGNTIRHTASYSMFNVVANLTRHANELVAPHLMLNAIQEKTKTKAPLWIGMEEHYNSDLTVITKKRNNVIDSFIIFDIWPPASPRNILCLEVMLHQHIIDVFLPSFTQTIEALAHKLSIDVLSAHFGIPFISPSVDNIKRFTDKSSFSNWMDVNGLGSYTPTVYKSNADVKYPCLVKSTSSAWGRDIYIVHNESELTAATERETAEYILQVCRVSM